MALTQVSTGGIEDGQVHTADLADAQITAAKLHANALDVTYTLGASGMDHYTFTGEGLTGAVNDPTLYLLRGKTYRFVNGNSSGAHPFRIQSVAGAGGAEYNTGVTNNSGAGGSTIVFTVPQDAPDVLYYICTSHPAMNGVFYMAGSTADASITTAKLADGSVTTAKLAADAVTQDKLANDSVRMEHILADQVTTSELATGAVTAVNIGDGEITTAKIGNDQITSALIASGAVTQTKIGDGSIINAKVDNAANIDGSKLADNSISLAKLQHGTSSNDGKFLRANNGADPTFETIGGGLPTGAIILWSGAANAIPTGYVLCDGNNSTPNLAGKFVVGYHASNGDYDVGDTGGAETVTLTEAQMPSHVHHFLIQNGSTSPMGYAQSANGTNIGWAGTNSKGGDQAHENRPPFYALCYIMKT
tara:strand:+ start:2485 stop:3741 length:1257 start_codon:yes stop_codon:yes gene_type:complete